MEMCVYTYMQMYMHIICSDEWGKMENWNHVILLSYGTNMSSHHC